MTAQELRPPPGKYKLRIEDYILLDRAGVFEDRRTELVEGDVILMSPEYRPHGYVKAEITYRVRDALRALQSELYPAFESSVAVSEHNMPRPDITLTSEPRGMGPIPVPSVALIIEVSDATLAVDLGSKASVYASAGVPEYWVADVNARTIHQMWAPTGDTYAERRETAFGQPLEAATIAGLRLSTEGL